jgi:hypothetical protein
MLHKVAKITFLILMPLLAFAGAKETIELQVVSSRTNMHNTPGDIFTYTDIIFATVSGKNLTFECAQKGDICPLMDTGKTYTATRDGKFIYISMNLPDEKRPTPVKYKEIGVW